VSEISSFDQLHSMIRARIDSSFNLGLLEKGLKESLDLVEAYKTMLGDKRKRLTQTQIKDVKKKEPASKTSKQRYVKHEPMTPEHYVKRKPRTPDVAEKMDKSFDDLHKRMSGKGGGAY
jgi:hypothetical protein